MSIEIHINPGSGLTDGDEATAQANIAQFIKDMETSDIQVYRMVSEDDYGRYAYLLREGKGFVLIHVPGIELSRIRYFYKMGHSAWDFYRLYVNTDSYLWDEALEIIPEIIIEAHNFNSRVHKDGKDYEIHQWGINGEGQLVLEVKTPAGEISEIIPPLELKV